LTHRAWDLDDARDDPALLVGLLVRDRHLQLLIHRTNELIAHKADLGR
jgi:hypothetical protein